MDDELKYIKEIFINLAYPTKIINVVLSNAKKKYYSPALPTSYSNNSITNKQFLVLPFVPSEDIKVLIPENISLINRISSNFKAEILFKHSNNNDSRMSGIYTIPCNNCDSVYYGETDYFCRRMSQHR